MSSFIYQLVTWKFSKNILLYCWSRGLVVMGGDSLLRGCRFEAEHWILYGSFSKLYCCKNYNIGVMHAVRVHEYW